MKAEMNFDNIGGGGGVVAYLVGLTRGLGGFVYLATDGEIDTIKRGANFTYDDDNINVSYNSNNNYFSITLKKACTMDSYTSTTYEKVTTSKTAGSTESFDGATTIANFTF